MNPIVIHMIDPNLSPTSKRLLRTRDIWNILVQEVFKNRLNPIINIQVATRVVDDVSAIRNRVEIISWNHFWDIVNLRVSNYIMLKVISDKLLEDAYEQL